MNTFNAAITGINFTTSNNGFDASHKKYHTWMIDAAAIQVTSWDIEHNFHTRKAESNKASLRSKLFLNFRYYPLLSIFMLVPAMASLTLMWAYWAFDALTINPGILFWAFVGFGGMYIVLISAAKEIHNAEKKAK